MPVSTRRQQKAKRRRVGDKQSPWVGRFVYDSADPMIRGEVNSQNGDRLLVTREAGTTCAAIPIDRAVDMSPEDIEAFTSVRMPSDPSPDEIADQCLRLRAAEFGSQVYYL